MKEWLSADLHLSHGNIAMYCGRPWLQEGDVIELPGERPKWVSPEIKEARTVAMNKDLVRNWNEIVSPEDTVKHLGDFCFWRAGSKEDAAYWESQLNGKIIHFKGNHDRSRQIKGMLNIATMKAGGHEFLLQHHPPGRIEEIPDFCDVVLCGHVHEAWEYKWVGHVLIVNVGVDVREFKPMSLDKIISTVDKLQRERSMIAWKAIVKAYDGLLLGGVKEYYSTPFARKKDAKAWLDVAFETNEKANREIDYENSLVFRIAVPSRVVIKAKKDDKPRAPAVTFGRSSR